MNHLPCGVVRDLLPLYIDDICSDESKTAVREHLETCPACRQLHDAMTASVLRETPPPLSHEDEKKLFHTVRTRLLSVSLLCTVTLICCFANLRDAWFGGPASGGSLAATLLFCAAFTVLPLLTREDSVLVRFFFTIHAVLFVSSACALLARLIDIGGFFSAFLGMPAGMLFYGFCIKGSWNLAYGIAFGTALLWLIFSSVCMYRIRKKKKRPSPDKEFLS